MIYCLPPKWKNCSLSKLLDYNASVTFRNRSVCCGNYAQKTKHSFKFELQSNFIMLEVIRVSEERKGRRVFWRKNNTSISFPITGISLCDRKYQVIATCHHRGSLQYGHWTSEVIMGDNTWYEFDDLRPKNLVCAAPGDCDSSVVVLLLMAESVIAR